MLQVFTALHKRRMLRPNDKYLSYSFILAQLRDNSYTVIDLAQLATILGRQRPPFPAPSSVARDGSLTSNAAMGGSAEGGSTMGGSKTDIGIGTAVAQLVQEIEELSCVHLRNGSMAPRQLACILWMFGRLGIQPSMSEFRGLICVFIRERVCPFLHVFMYSRRLTETLARHCHCCTHRLLLTVWGFQYQHSSACVRM